MCGGEGVVGGWVTTAFVLCRDSPDLSHLFECLSEKRSVKFYLLDLVLRPDFSVTLKVDLQT